MGKKYYQMFWQWIRYVCTGVSSFLLDISLLILIKEYGGVSPVIAIIWSQGFVMCYNFLLNKRWSFQRKTNKYKKEAIKYLFLAGCNYVIGIICMYIGHHTFGLDYRIVRIGTIALMACWNFFLYKYWVFQESSDASVYNVSDKEA